MNIFFMDCWYPNRDRNLTCVEHKTETILLNTFPSEIVCVSSIKGYSAHPSEIVGVSSIQGYSAHPRS